MLENLLEGVTKVMAKIFGTKSERDIKALKPVVEEINEIYDGLSELSDEELKAKTEEFRNKIKNATEEIEADMATIRDQLEHDDDLSFNERHELAEELEDLEDEWQETTEEVLEEIMPEAFAVMKDTCRRFLGKSWNVAGSETEWDMIPYDVQLIGAVAMHRGTIAEMKTGEGKTLAAIMPAYLNALTGKGVHIVTVNNYLAKRDAEWNEPLFNFHGLTVDCVDLYQPNSEQRRQAYRADITYGTNNEFGFDYLRDNMVIKPDQLVQRDHNFAIIDEVDSILIDEARTPLIISGPVPQDTQSHKYDELRPRIESLVEAQKRLVAKLVNEAEKLYEEGNEEKAGLQFFRSHRGFPKNKKLRKLKQEPKIQKLIRQTEYFYLQDNAKNLPIVDEELYYSVDHKQNSIEMTEKGREFLTNKDEDKDFFVIPDMGTETSDIDDEIEEEYSKKIEEVKQNEEFSEDYKEKKIADLRAEKEKERERRLSELNRLFAERSDRIHTVNQLLKAYTMFEREEEYIVQDGKVQIVDEHTGRVLSGRRYSDGLHQAIEAKERVKVEAATQTYATITLQNFFRMYNKLSGMTGTAATEEGEFNEIYDLDVVVIPTNEPVIRDDKEDLVFRSKREKYNAVIQKIQNYYDSGQPVLVGTTSVDVSEKISRMLKSQKIPHNVLNAKHNKDESEIVAEAGQKKSVTVATNMAGRGTDIKLGDGVRELGGLAILGTERHESRRIDLQLRGRAGRQGDPGESQFYVSLEDDLMQLFGSDKVANVMDKLNFEEGEVIQHSWITKSLERAQKKVEQNNFSIRKKQLEYDDVLNNQREVVYARRKHALLGDQLRDDIYDMLEDLTERIVTQHFENGELEEIRDTVLRFLAVDVELDRERWAELGEDGLIDHIMERAVEVYRKKETLITEPLNNVLQQIQNNDEENRPSAIQIFFTDGIRRLRVIVDVEEAIETEGMEVVRSLERTAILSIIDDKWMEHLRELDSVKEGIGLRAFGQKDPLLEYKREAFEMFKTLIDEINQEATSLIWKAVPEASEQDQRFRQAQQPQRSKVDLDKMKTQHEDSTNMGIKFGGQQEGGNDKPVGGDHDKKPEPVTVEDEPGRNDPCPCGSGKKYKHCHGR